MDRDEYLVDGDPGAEVRFYVPQAQLGQVHGVLGQVLGYGEGVDVLEAGEPQLHAHELEHRVAFAPKYLNQQELCLLVGHHPCARWMAAETQEGSREGRHGRQRPVEGPGPRGNYGKDQMERARDRKSRSQGIDAREKGQNPIEFKGKARGREERQEPDREIEREGEGEQAKERGHTSEP